LFIVTFLIQIYLGKQPRRNQTVTYDPKVGFILDPVTEEDTDTFRCRGTNRMNSYNSRFPYREIETELGDSESIKFTLDVSKYFTNCRYACQNVPHLYCCFEYEYCTPYLPFNVIQLIYYFCSFKVIIDYAFHVIFSVL
jgi:hypothetical protein